MLPSRLSRCKPGKGNQNKCFPNDRQHSIFLCPHSLTQLKIWKELKRPKEEKLQKERAGKKQNTGKYFYKETQIGSPSKTGTPHNLGSFPKYGTHPGIPQSCRPFNYYWITIHEPVGRYICQRWCKASCRAVPNEISLSSSSRMLNSQIRQICHFIYTEHAFPHFCFTLT